MVRNACKVKDFSDYNEYRYLKYDNLLLFIDLLLHKDIISKSILVLSHLRYEKPKRSRAAIYITELLQMLS